MERKEVEVHCPSCVECEQKNMACCGVRHCSRFRIWFRKEWRKIQKEYGVESNNEGTTD